MDSKSIFNATICILGVLILLLHVIALLLKKNRRKDENALLSFFIFTVIHFATYFTFVMIKTVYTSDVFIVGFYTTFYIMNNLEVFLFYLYLSRYLNLESKYKHIIDIVDYVLLGVFIISDIVNIFTHMYFSSIDGVYTRSQFMIISQGYQFIILVTSFVLTILAKTINAREKTAFSIYCFLPAISIVVQNAMPGYAVAYLTLFVAVEVLFLFLNVEKNIRIEEDERKLKDANVKIMMSQIQPHFIYNTLSSISTLTTIDPKKAQQALDDFSDYLRMNFSSLTETHLVPFNDELQHIKVYTGLEKLRFNERLKVVYNIEVKDFLVPPLSVQPIVENAIKHGIIKKVDGGTVTIHTYENGEAYIVEVVDDGIGFDLNEVNFKDNEHIGLNNVKQRINSMCKGDICFESKKNEGTKVTISFYKE